MRFIDRFLAGLTAITAATAVTACGSDLTTPSDSNPGSATGSAVATVDSSLGSGSAGRIEIELFPGEMVAREVHVENDDDEEKLVSRVTAIDPVAGSLTLELGALVVSYGSDTRFRTETESHESRAAWEAAVQSAIGAGAPPLIEARRNRPAAPQAPDDRSFTAVDLRLENDDDAPKLELYVDNDNLASAGGESSVVLRVLGLEIEVNGRTQLREDNGVDDGDNSGGDDNGGGNDDGGQPSGTSVEFEMGVTAADAAAGTITLSSGTLVRITSATAISAEGDLFTIESVAAAVAAGRPVRAEGRATVESAGPPAVLAATSLKVEVDD